MGDLRIFDLNKLKYQFGLTVFVETGTLFGAGVDYALETFDIVHSIEIDEDLVNQAKEKYKNNDKVTIHQGHSPTVLAELLLKLDGAILFWLDAHFPGADSHAAGYLDEKDMNKRLPLELELEAIKIHALAHNDVIIIDDMWLYESGDFEWGKIDNHLKNVNKLDITREELVGKNSDFIYRIFQGTHEITNRYNHQGYYIIKPL